MNIQAKVKVPIRVVRSFLGIQRKRKDRAHERLFTSWGEELQQAVDAGEPPRIRSEHPHPQFKRANFEMLDGWWDFATQRLGSMEEARLAWVDAPPPAEYPERILVPFPPESALSQVERTVHPNELMWYRRAFATPRLSAGERLVLHFEAVDWACAVYVNGMPAEVHTGAYLPFAIDITGYLLPGREKQEIALCAWDPSEFGPQLRGKQRINRIGMWYTAQSGIWQPVWLERVPEERICGLQIDSFNLNGTICCTVECTAPQHPGTTLTAAAYGGNELVAEASCAPLADEAPGTESHSGLSAGNPRAARSTATARLTLTVRDPKPWSPESPHLYRLKFSYGADEVESYCGFRTVQVAPDANGTPRIMLNGEPRFVKGLLDQGYWPESLMTAPSLAALTFDAKAIRRLGFNTARKHLKVESDAWYGECDRLGVLVWQDVPSGGAGWNEWETTVRPSTFRSHQTDRDDTPRSHARHSAASARYRDEWTQTALGMVRYLKNHPSVIAWSLFNEGWGQFDSAEAVRRVRAEDPSRPVDAASGWFDQGAGDIASTHDYAEQPGFTSPAKSGRAEVLTEFGGLTLPVAGHMFNTHSFGYRSAGGPSAWRDEVARLISRVESQRAAGLAGCIYTQLTDVEEELNGLLTYDRKDKR